MYDLFILGELMTEPKHGYLLQEILKSAVGPFRQISSGTLYPLIRRLMENKWIRHHQLEEQQEGGRLRKIYEITEMGQKRFQELMVKPLEYNLDTELIFHFKLSFFQYVTKDFQLTCLEQYLGYLQYNLQYVMDSEAIILSKKIIPEKKRMQLVRMFDHRKKIGTADIDWVTMEIKRLKASQGKEE